MFGHPAEDLVYGGHYEDDFPYDIFDDFMSHEDIDEDYPSPTRTTSRSTRRVTGAPTKKDGYPD